MKQGPPFIALVGAFLVAQSTAALAAQPITLGSAPYEPFVALDLDGGVSRNLELDRSAWLGGASAGLGLFNSDHLWEVAAGVRKIAQEALQVTCFVSRAGVDNGLGLHLGGLWLPGPGVVGAGAGLSFSVLNAQAGLFFDHERTKLVSLFVRLPVGLIFHALSRRQGGVQK